MNILKLSTSSLFLLAPLICFAQQTHDFAFYKDETIKLFHILKVDPAAVSFVEVTKVPTIEEREQHKNTIFLNTAALNAKPRSIALFSCAVEAKLGTLSDEQWKKITKFKDTPPIMPIFLAFIPTVFFGIHLFTEHHLDEKPFNFTSSFLLGLIGASWIGSYVLYKTNKINDQQARIKELQYVFESIKCRIQMDLLRELLSSEQSAVLAIAGFLPTKLQQNKTIELIKTHPGIFTGLAGISLIKHMSTLELMIELWASQHPEQTELITQQLKHEYEPFKNGDLSVLEV